jgi:hypothetical protein
MALNGQPFVNPGDGTPAYFGPSGGAGSAVTFQRPPILTSTPLNILVPGEGYLRTDTVADFAGPGGGTGLAAQELYTMQVGRCCCSAADCRCHSPAAATCMYARRACHPAGSQKHQQHAA